MAEMCADCGAWFGSPAEVILHLRKAHSGGNARDSLAMNPESHRAGLVCALCGRRFSTMDALTRHNLSPHPSTTPRPRPTPRRQPLY